MKQSTYLLVVLTTVLLAIGVQTRNDGLIQLEPVPVSAKELESSSPTTSSSYVTVRIQKGDTLYSLAKKYGASVQQIAEQNQISNPSRIQIGQSIRILQKGSKIVPSNHGNLDQAKVDPLQGFLPTASKEDVNLQMSWHRGKVLGEFTIVAMTPPLQSKSSLSGVTIGVDPKVISVGSRVYVPGIGYRTARDAEGRVSGNQIELYVESTAKAKEYGTKNKVSLELVD